MFKNCKKIFKNKLWTKKGQNSQKYYKYYYERFILNG